MVYFPFKVLSKMLRYDNLSICLLHLESCAVDIPTRCFEIEIGSRTWIPNNVSGENEMVFFILSFPVFKLSRLPFVTAECDKAVFMH